MSEQTVTYADLPFCAPPKEKTKQKGKPSRIPGESFYPYNPSEISEQEVIYSDLKCHAPSKSQRKPTPTVSENRESCSESLLWQLTAAILGSLCLVLLAISGVLGALLRSQIGILPQQEEVLKNLTQLNETLENCTLERDNFKAQNTNLKGEKCSAYLDCWKHHRGKFYYFTKERKSYQECKAKCSSHGSKLLKIENKDEMNFLNSLPDFHWIGLTRKGIASEWKWKDGTPHFTDLFPVWKSQLGQSYAVFNAGQAYTNSCDEQRPCVCVKRTE
ncbi:PREDICTED: natural killer cells antigen CD94-like isoform X2 [Gavialis gangeticus]|uniref:natural killer cells antigen CD94-like isoform X2 n=1 Tax=Gavialis gangeticus TaxID=94835 RepID=UPI00092F7636|nr:PREDICTED: natural killer cells antigen CD94-like isoform X2 [Gavialis gangeticus]